uniref:RING-type E3 ubiquitin transferase n=1 Tax=Tanacetum cinerariifolium TaxID=118510 RepID=A0A6L2NZ73_TANCI|nr:aminotransferase-like mobile domain-containing protein [Tanacetum cinerariifolium]
MVRFSITEEEEDDQNDDVPINCKRRRFSCSSSQFQQQEENLLEEEDDGESESDDDIIVLLPEGGDVAVNSVTENANGALSVVFTDPDVLDCPICLDPLCAPVFQCENGHIACNSCCSKVKRICPSCCMPIGYNRCRAIEKVTESVQVSCKNVQYGCKETMAYYKKHEHEQMCPHVTCFCPHPSCPFAGSSRNLYHHFGIRHTASTTRFTYNTTFTLPVELNQKRILLQEQHESVIFILNHEVKQHGRSFNVDCVGPDTLKTSFEYQLIAKNMETSLSVQSVPEIYSKWSEHTLKKSYLTVPSDFLGYSGILSLHVCIKKAILSNTLNIEKHRVTTCCGESRGSSDISKP